MPITSLARLARTSLAICALVATACSGGGDGVPTGPSEPREPRSPAPTPPPAATIQLAGDTRLTECVRRDATSRCTLQETGRNVGPGCATSVRIRVRVLAGETEVATERWSSGSTRVFMPDEEFTYSVNIVLPNETFPTVTQFGRSAEWDVVRCPAPTP